MSAGGLPSACWCCGATAAGLRKRAKSVRVRPLSQQAAAALVVQQKPLALAVGGLLPGHAATHSLNVLCNSCNTENGRQLAAVLLPRRDRPRGRALEQRAAAGGRGGNAQGLTRAAAVRSYHSVG